MLTDPKNSHGFNFDGESKTFGGLPARVPNTVTALSGDAPLSGPKVTSFDRNVGGDLEHVTNDTWMAQFGDVDQKTFATYAGYVTYPAKVREAGANIAWHAAEIQETIWCLFKTLADSTNTKMDAKTVLRGLTNEDVAGSPAFHTILEIPNVRAALSAAGFQQSAVDAAKASGEAAGPRGNPTTGKIWDGRLTPDIRDILARANKYAKHGPQRRAANAAAKAAKAEALINNVATDAAEEVTG